MEELGPRVQRVVIVTAVNSTRNTGIQNKSSSMGSNTRNVNSNSNMQRKLEGNELIQECVGAAEEEIPEKCSKLMPGESCEVGCSSNYILQRSPLRVWAKGPGRGFRPWGRFGEVGLK